MPEKIMFKGKILDNSKSISNAFNNYFVNVSTSLCNSISASTNCEFTTTSLIQNCNNTLFLRPIGETEVLKHINNLNNSKSIGKYGIPIKYIKLAAIVISPTLVNIYNCCISTGCYPNILKIALVIPIYKSVLKNLCSNYRPISILNPFSNIFEKCLHTQVYNYFTQNSLLSKNQYSFIKHSSTSDAEMDAYNEILANLNEKKITCSHIYRFGQSI